MTEPLTTSVGPCEPWPVRWLCDVSCESAAVTGQAVRFATEVAWALSGRQFGLCTATLRPCRRECLDWSWPTLSAWSEWTYGGYPYPALVGGVWFNLACGACPDTCSCTTLSQVVLPNPVHSIVEVKVDGAPLVTGAYRLDNGRYLVRVDGNEWPECNDLSKNDSQVGTWSVMARLGLDVPESGAWAVGELACQYIQARNGGDCRLPRSVTQLVRQGVTIQLADSVDLLREGLTGLHLVDIFVRTWNPHGLARRSRTYSVDRPAPRRTGT